MSRGFISWCVDFAEIEMGEIKKQRPENYSGFSFSNLSPAIAPRLAFMFPNQGISHWFCAEYRLPSIIFVVSMICG
jgi:hypothetical protein